MRRLAARGLLALALASCAAAQEAPRAAIELIRDAWHTPHVFAASDADAMYGLGYATAEDRAFQMVYSLRILQGRLAETIGNLRARNAKRGDAVAHDRKMRNFGFWRAAERIAGELDAESRALLAAYSAGVNAYFAEHRRDLGPMFAKYELVPEPWCPAACLASWWHLAQFFATDGTRDLIAWRNLVKPRRPQPPRVAPDDAAAVIQRGDVSDEWVEKVAAFVQQHGIAPDGDGSGEGRKFSHAWVVGGERSTTGAATLVSDPQTPVANPSLLYEFHVKGASFDARGVGVPGSPVILIGWNRQVAWGMTALGADQADLFRLETDPAHPDAYRFDGQWRPMRVRREQILVRGGEAVEHRVRETHLGPVVTSIAYRQPGEPEVALRRVPICDRGVETIQGALAMMRARSAAEFLRALEGWRFPSANAVFGDAEGHIGYAAVGAIPVRSRHARGGGRAAQDGSSTRFEWQGFVPFELMPQVLDPAGGVLFSANHRPIASFYRIPIGNSTGSLGETLRSWRLRELLSEREQYHPYEALRIHFDTTNPARRDLVRLGLHLRDAQGARLHADALAALEHLEPWLERGASSDLREPGAALAGLLSMNFRFVATQLTRRHGGGQSGLCRFLREACERITSEPDSELGPLARSWIDRELRQAWRVAQRRYGDEPSNWSARAMAAVGRRRLGYYESLDGFPSLERAHDLPFPPIWCVDGSTIHCQAAQAYTQYVPLHDVDTALSLLPIGPAERPGDPARTSALEVWGLGGLQPAPLSRAVVEKIARSSRILERPK